MAAPTNVQFNLNAPFPALVTGTGPVTIAKTNGIWQVGFSIDGLGIRNPSGSDQPSEYVIVWDVVQQTFYKVQLSKMFLSGLVTGQIQTSAELISTQNIAVVNGLNSNVNWVNSRIRLTGPTGAFSIGGFVQFGDGWRLYVHNSVAQTCTIVNNDASSTETNRIFTNTGANVVLRAAAQSFFTLSYDAGFLPSGGTLAGRWILESFN